MFEAFDLLRFLEDLPLPGRVAVVLLAAFALALPFLRRTWIEYRHRTNELQRDLATLAVLKLQYEIEVLRKELVAPMKVGPEAEMILPSAFPLYLPNPSEAFEKLSVRRERRSEKSSPDLRLRLRFGLIGTAPLGTLASIAAWDNDPGPTAFAFVAWCAIGVVTAMAGGGASRLRSVLAGLLGPILFGFLLTVVVGDA